MSIVTTSAARALRSLTAPGVVPLVLMSAVLTVLVLVGFAAGLGALTSHWATDAQTGHAPALGWLVGLVGGILLTVLLFPLLMPLVVSFFDEALADRIERHAYPQLAIGTSQPIWRELLADVRFTAKAIFLNALVLPTMLIPPLYLVVYGLMNAYLLGTQFFMMAGGRHIGKANARALARKHTGTVLLAGGVIVLCSTIPFLNLLAPFWGVALMVHVFQAIHPMPMVDAPAHTLPPEVATTRSSPPEVATPPASESQVWSSSGQ